MVRVVYIVVLLVFSGCNYSVIRNDSGEVLYPSYEPVSGIRVVSIEGLPKSACFGARDECFQLLYARGSDEGLMYLMLVKGKVKRIYKFYTSRIDNVFVEDNKLFIVFVDQTELYGWIEWKNGEYIFQLFYDSEL